MLLNWDTHFAIYGVNNEKWASPMTASVLLVYLKENKNNLIFLHLVKKNQTYSIKYTWTANRNLKKTQLKVFQ